MPSISDEMFGTGSHPVEKISDALPKMRELYRAQLDEEDKHYADVIQLWILQMYYCYLDNGDCACKKLRQYHGLE